jgi:hypothetical protein
MPPVERHPTTQEGEFQETDHAACLAGCTRAQARDAGRSGSAGPAVTWLGVRSVEPVSAAAVIIRLAKVRTEHTVAHEQFAYVIWVHNGGQELAAVSDRCTAGGGRVRRRIGHSVAAYDEATRTLSWDSVGSIRGAVLLSSLLSWPTRCLSPRRSPPGDDPGRMN